MRGDGDSGRPGECRRGGDMGRKLAKRRGRGRALVKRRGLSLQVLQADDTHATHGLLLLDAQGFAGKDLGDLLFRLQSLFLKQHGDLCMGEGPRFQKLTLDVER